MTAGIMLLRDGQHGVPAPRVCIGLDFGGDAEIGKLGHCNVYLLKPDSRLRVVAKATFDTLRANVFTVFYKPLATGHQNWPLTTNH